MVALMGGKEAWDGLKMGARWAREGQSDGWGGGGISRKGNLHEVQRHNNGWKVVDNGAC